MSKRKTENISKAAHLKNTAILPIVLATALVAAGIGGAAYFMMSSGPSGSVDYENGENEGTGGSSVNSNPIALMKVKSADGSISGTIKIELYKNKAPVTVDNFIKYAKDGFYNGLVFHRVIPSFVVQGGGFYYNQDNALAYKNPTYPPIKNEANNGLSNLKGTIAMARTNDPNSATSQFYFNLKDNTNLDYSSSNPGYCVFGKVVGGWSTVESMVNVETHTETAHFPQGDETMEDVPTVHLIIESVTIQGA